MQFYSSDVARFSRLKELKIDGVTHRAVKITAEGEYGYIQLADVNSAEEAELLRGHTVGVSRADLPELADGKYYVADMIGLDVYVGSDLIGRLSDIQQYGSADVYTVKNENGSLSFPALKQLIKRVDLQNGRMILDEITFQRVVVYN